MNLVKQLQKLVKVRYVEDITDAERVGESDSLTQRFGLYSLLSLLEDVQVASHTIVQEAPGQSFWEKQSAHFMISPVMGREGAGAVEDKSAARAHKDRGHAAH